MKTLLLLLLLPSLSFAQHDSTEAIINRIMQKQRIVGLSIAVVKNGEVLLNKGFGLANVEHNVPMTNESVIRLGSVSKQFFSTAIMKLMEEGKLTLDDPVHKFFPDAPETWRPVTLKQLMSHTSGLPREGPAYDNFTLQPDLDVIKSAYTLPMEFNPGEKYQYCNLGYYMLAEIIKQITGIPWQTYIQNELFLPSNMQNSFVTDFYLIIPNRANGYMHHHDTLVNAYPMYAIRPSGGFVSTTSDMIKWDRTIREGKTIIRKENWEALWKPMVKVSEKPESHEYYGLGWGIDIYKGHRMVAHGGSNPGFRSAYARFIDDNLSIIILTNTSEANPYEIVFALADYHFRKSDAKK